MRRHFGVLAANVVLVAGIAGALPPSATALTQGERLIDDARRAAQQASFTARVLVQWHDGQVEHRDDVFVVARDGEMLVSGGTAVVARQYERLVRHSSGGDWAVLWPGGVGPGATPDPSAKYTITAGPGPEVAGHPTRMVEVRRGTGLRERFYVLSDSGLLVGREQYGAGGELVRRVRFESLTMERPGELPSVASVRSASLSGTALATRAAPNSLAGGYRRLGAYRRTGVVQVVYSDGIYGLSVFEQPGRLKRSDLPARGSTVNVGGEQGRRYSWPGGHVLVWQDDDVVYTTVGDGPLAEVLAAARSLPSPGGPSVVEKLRRACRALLQGFSEQ